MVVEQHDGNVGGFEPVFQLAQALKGTAAAVPDQQSLLLGQFTSRMGSCLVRDLFEVVDQTEIDVGRQDVLANAFRDVGVDFVFVELTRLVYFLNTEPYESMPQI